MANSDDKTARQAGLAWCTYCTQYVVCTETVWKKGTSQQKTQYVAILGGSPSRKSLEKEKEGEGQS